MFTIDDTDFEIDHAKSSFNITALKSGDMVLNVEIYGDMERYKRITEDYDTSPWSWTLYPPHFYIRSYPAKMAPVAGTFEANVSSDDLDDYEVAIYLMEHHDVDQIEVSADCDSFKAAGIVYISGGPRPFSISFTKKAVGDPGAPL